jgi:diacylglycerol kinase family enzyme
VSISPLIVVNPRAARLHDPAGRRDTVAMVVRAVHARTGVDPRVEEGSLADAQAALAGSVGASLVVAIGGDGTIRQAAAAMAGTGTPIAVVPGGTGNVLAGSLGIGGVGPALDAIRHGPTRTMDLGEARWGPQDGGDQVESSVFLVACGMGLDARIMAAAEHEWKRRMRFGAYIGAAVRELARLKAAEFRIVADGTPIEMRGYLVLVANAGELVPGKVGPRRRIDPSDGRLDLIVVGGSNPLKGLHGAARLMLSDRDLQDAVVRRQVGTVRIEAHPAQPIETDGDHHPPGWLEARVLPGALTIVGRVR